MDRVHLVAHLENLGGGVVRFIAPSRMSPKERPLPRLPHHDSANAPLVLYARPPICCPAPCDHTSGAAGSVMGQIIRMFNLLFFIAVDWMNIFSPEIESIFVRNFRSS